MTQEPRDEAKIVYAETVMSAWDEYMKALDAAISLYGQDCEFARRNKEKQIAAAKVEYDSACAGAAKVYRGET